MEANRTSPLLIPASTAVLLCFLPTASSPEMYQERMLLTARLQQVLPSTIRILKVDESLHPEVVKSFNLHQLPAFVLVQRGIEYWRKEGVGSTDVLAALPGLLQKVNSF